MTEIVPTHSRKHLLLEDKTTSHQVALSLGISLEFLPHCPHQDTAHMLQALAYPRQFPTSPDLSEDDPGLKTSYICFPNFSILRHC